MSACTVPRTCLQGRAAPAYSASLNKARTAAQVAPRSLIGAEALPIGELRCARALSTELGLLADRGVHEERETIGAGPLMVIETEVDGAHRSKPAYRTFGVFDGGDRNAGLADLAVDVRAFVGVFAVEGDAVEGRREAHRRLPLASR
jgi:hypothetical protein